MKKKLAIVVLIILSVLHFMNITVSANDYDGGEGSSWSSSDCDDDDNDNDSHSSNPAGAIIFYSFMGIFSAFIIVNTIYEIYTWKIEKTHKPTE